MMTSVKKSYIWLAVFGVGVFLAVLLSWRTGQVYDAMRLEWFQRLQQIPGMAVTWHEEERGLFSRQSQLHLCILDPERVLASEQLPSLPAHLQSLLRRSGVVDLYVKQETWILPGQLRGRAWLRFDQGTPAEFVAKGEMTPTRQLLHWQVNSWDKALEFELASEGIKLHKPNITLNMPPFQIKLEQQAEQHLLSWHIPALQLEYAQRMVEFSGITGQLGLKQHQTNWLMPSLHLGLQSAKLTSIGEQFDLQELNLQTSVNANKQGFLSLVDTNWLGSLKSVQYQASSSHAPLILNDMQLALQLGGLEQHGLRQLFNEWGQAGDDKRHLLQAINRITRSGFSINLDRLALRLHEGVFSANGSVNSTPFDLTHLQSLASLRSLLQGKLNLNANHTLTQTLLPLRDQLLSMQAAGYLDQEQDKSGNFKSQLRMVNGKLSANGVAVPW